FRYCDDTGFAPARAPARLPRNWAMIAMIGAEITNIVIHVADRGRQGTEPFHPTRSQAQMRNVTMYTTNSVIAAGNAIRVAFVSASRYAAHAVAPSESTALGSGAACSRRPPTAST